MASQTSASLDPADFRHEIRERPALQISQVDHPFQVRGIEQLHVPCACGRPLCGVETEWINDAQGNALYFMGVCLSCGKQEGIYMSAPNVTADAADKRRKQQLEAEITAMVEQVTRLREQPETVTATTTGASVNCTVEAA